MSTKLPQAVAQSANTSVANSKSSFTKREWSSPRVEAMPRLTELTLVTGEGIGGGESLFP
jgi:hypothetical protein